MTTPSSPPPTNPVRPLALVGMMAVGKTAVGAELARRLGRPFLDLDAEVVTREGRPIAEIFGSDGEEHFRRLEHDLLAEQLERVDGCVLATGGGVVKAASNRQALREQATVVWLRCRPETIVARARGNPNRPLLRPPDGETVSDLVRRLDTEREPLYAEVADLVFDADDVPAPEVARRLAGLIAGGTTSRDRLVTRPDS